MNPDPALYRPDGDDVADLCADLRAAGLIDRGPDTALRLRAAFTRLDPMPAERLVGVVRAVCRRHPEPARRQALDEVVGDWIARLAPAVEPSGPRRAATQPPTGRPAAEAAQTARPRWLIGVAFIALVTVVALATTGPDGPQTQPDAAADATPDMGTTDGGGYDAGPDAHIKSLSDAADAAIDAISDPLPDGNNPSPPDATPDISTDATADMARDAEPDAGLPPLPDADLSPAPRPTYAGLTEPIPTPWPAPWALLGLLALLAAAIALARLARDLEPIPRPLRRLIAPTADRRPPRPLPAAQHIAPRMLPRDAERRLAGSDQRATADPTSRALDVRASVKATAARDGRIPVARFRPLRRPAPLNLWIDWAARARTPALARTVDELVATLKRTGLAHVRLRFVDSPQILIDGGRRIVLDGLPIDRRATRVAVITDGHGLMRLGSGPARRLGGRLSRFEHLAFFIFGELDPDRLAEQLRLTGRVHRDDRLLSWIADRAPGRPQPIDPARLRAWAAACALAPRGADDTDAIALAEHLALGVPPSAIEALRADCGHPRIEWATAQRAALIDGLSKSDPGLRDAAVAWWRARYEIAPTGDDGGPQCALERLTLGLWTDDPDRVARAAEALGRLGIEADARELLAAYAPCDVLPNAPLIHLPWAWSDLRSARARRQLTRLGLADGRLPRPPGRRFALLGLAVGLAAAAAVGAFTAPRGERMKPAPCVVELPAAGGGVAEVWRCGSTRPVRPTEPVWPAHSAVTLFGSPDGPDTAALALALLDAGAADSVWWGALPPESAADQRIAVLRGARACPAEATACVRAGDWPSLGERLGPRVRPLAEVWPGVERGAGWLLGVEPATDVGVGAGDAAVDAGLDAEPDATPDVGRVPEADTPDAGFEGLTLTGFEVVDEDPRLFAIRLLHDEGSPLEARMGRRPDGSRRVVVLRNAQWAFAEQHRDIVDAHVNGLSAVHGNQLYIGFAASPAVHPIPSFAVEPTAGGSLITFDRAHLDPAPDAAPPQRDASLSDAGITPNAATDASPPDRGVEPLRRHAKTRHRPALVPIRPGEFVMGSPLSEAGRGSDERAHPVKLTRGFLMAETEVTQAQYAALMGENPSRFKGTAVDGARPVEQVSWLDAVKYCNALSAEEGLPPAYTIAGDDVRWGQDAAGYRLPTEAEWEYAARAGTATATYAGDLDIVGDNNAPVLDDIAWYGGNSGSAHPQAWDSSGWPEKQHPHDKASTHPVKGKRPNPWGLYDMLGNVWEWTWDWYADDPSSPNGAPLADPAGPARGRRVIRGGSFVDLARYVRAAYRNWRLPGFRSGLLGFRPVRFAGPPPRAR